MATSRLVWPVGLLLGVDVSPGQWFTVYSGRVEWYINAVEA